MRLIICEKCGANDFQEFEGYRICRYCNTKYIIEREDALPKTSKVALCDDIELLLQKCRDDPANARRYANLILDIDADNIKALKYL